MTLFDLCNPQVEIDTPIRLIEMFAGYGSQAMALRNLGADFVTYRAIEIDRYAMASYNAIHGTDFPCTDIKDVKGEDLGITDKDNYTYLCTYSFPCTDISIAGRMAGMGEDDNTRSSLLWQVKRILTELSEIDALPQILLMENVPAIHNPQNIDDFQKWTGFLSDMGYSNYSGDLNAVDFGVAQNRERTFLVSILGEYAYTFPTGMDLTKCIEDYFEDLTEEMAEKYVVKSPKALELLVKLDEENRLD